MKHRKRLGLLFLALLLAASLRGVETAFWQIGSFEEFLQGKLSGVLLSKEGELRLAPEGRVVFSPEEALALSLARDRNHTIYVGTGHQGKVFRVDANQKAALLFTAKEPDIFALAAGLDGALYVGSSPEGKVYRVTPDGKSQVFYDPKTKYIWALVFDAQGRLYVATGDKGQIFRVDPSGKGELFFDSKQTHIMCLTLDRDGSLLAGSVPNGLIYRLTPQGKPFVLYQASLPEIRDLATDSQGHIYAAALGGAGGKGSPEILVTPAPGGMLPGPVTTVTVTAAEEGRKPAGAQNPPGESPPAPSFNRPAPLAPGMVPLQMPQGRGSLIEIFPDSTAETIWSSNNESIFGLAVRDRHVLFSTDSNGRIFDLDLRRDGPRLTLLTETHESLATRLMFEGSDLYIATSNIAKLFRVAATPSREGSYESPVKDTKFISRWGVLAWRGELPQEATLEFYTHSGNSDRPDRTWSDWAGPYRSPNGSPISSPPARYIQWKVVLRGSGEANPTLDEVTVSYLNQNLPPQIRSLTVSTAGERTSPTGTPSSPGASPGAMITISPLPSSSFGPSPPSGTTTAKSPVTFTWQADDPNNDQLMYALYIKAADEQEWHLLKDQLRQANYSLEPNTLADGKYVARLVASDEESNPPETARRSELLSAPFWIDNTPPEVRVLRQKVEANGGEVQFQVEDSTSPLRSAETSIDGKDWRDLVADDGIVDSRQETFTVKLTKLEPGEHVISLRASDTAGNVGVGKVVIRIAAEGSTTH
jgi:sugar lactone lactonase YvrE